MKKNFCFRSVFCSVFIPIIVLPLVVMGADKEWTWCWIKKFDVQERKKIKADSVLEITREGVPAFTQLVLSSNVMRPETGYFSFFVQVRDQETKKWGFWHKILDWGAERQTSYQSQPDGVSQNFYVRLETSAPKKADGFRLKVAVQGGANLASVYLLGVTLSDFTKFNPEMVRHSMPVLASVYIENVPSISQMFLSHPEARYLCNPTAWAMVMSFLLKKTVDAVAFSYGVFDNGLKTHGSWPFNVLEAFNVGGGAYYIIAARCSSFKQLHAQLQRGIPVVVSVKGKIKGAPKDYPFGHMLVVIGWDKETREVICHDPAIANQKSTLIRYPLKSFLAAWERRYRFVYFVNPNDDVVTLL